MSFRRISIPEEKQINGKVFPLTITPNCYEATIDEIIYYIHSNPADVLDALKNHGAILFRNFPLIDPIDFNDFALSFGWEDFPYIGRILFTNFYNKTLYLLFIELSRSLIFYINSY